MIVIVYLADAKYGSGHVVAVDYRRMFVQTNIDVLRGEIGMS